MKSIFYSILIISFCFNLLPVFSCEHDEHDVSVKTRQDIEKDDINLKEKKKKKNKKTKITKPADDDVILELDDEEVDD